MLYYRWSGESNDGSYKENGKHFLASKEDCYNEMRNAVLEKMKWNTEFSEDFETAEDAIQYDVKFTQNSIVHKSYSGTYTYQIREFELVDDGFGVTLLHEKTDNGGRMWLNQNNDIYEYLFMEYKEGDYYPLDILSALTVRWNAENLGASYFLRPSLIKGGITLMAHYCSDTLFSRLVWLNQQDGFDGVVLLDSDYTKVQAISLSDVRQYGLTEAVKMANQDIESHTYKYADSKTTFPTTAKLDWGGRKWKQIEQLPERKSVWLVVESFDEFTLWMDNEYGEIYLEWKGNFYKDNI